LKGNDVTTRVWCQQWEETEKDWGPRPDGYSLHLTQADRTAFVGAYWDGMPDEQPDEFSRPLGTPYKIDADDETVAKLQAAAKEHGIRDYNTGATPQPPAGMRGVWRRDTHAPASTV
jgi:hypothetical protein